MTLARSLMHKDTTLDVEFPDERDDYMSDDEPTVKIQVPTFHPQVVVSETRYPGVGLLICLGTGLAFWGTVAYFIFH